ncbi:D-amino acid dehydrogenase [Zavarzinia sp. CC-PAN008]|uniref:D-amino acid dehydrogenase n=1 Tax=Zavarzinia sp. CC-PAN008 TaxID=3243332 RepID=UPI003F7477DA
MKVVVLGAGVVGVTAAHALARDGHEVTVVERNPGVAEFTSFANAGLMAPGHAFSWAQPTAPMTLLRSLFKPGQALRFRPSLDWRMWAWSWRFLTQCTAARAAENTRHKLRICVYSQQELHRILEETGVACHLESGGLLYVYRDAAALDLAAAKSKILTAEGIDQRLIEPGEVVQIEPGLAQARDRIAGALFSPTDESGDARTFTINLAAHCAERMGVVFRHGVTVTGFEVEGGRAVAVQTSAGRIAADAFVLALGVYSPHLARSLGLNLPVYPIKGYSITLPIGPQHTPPRLGGMDEHYLISWARYGDRLRAAAVAEFAGYDTSFKPSDFETCLTSMRELFPNGADHAKPQYWAGLRPMTPGGQPILGVGPVRNVVINTGHGSMGWTMGPGSATITADLIAGRRPAIRLDGMDPRA